MTQFVLKVKSGQIEGRDDSICAKGRVEPARLEGRAKTAWAEGQAKPTASQRSSRVRTRLSWPRLEVEPSRPQAKGHAKLARTRG